MPADLPFLSYAQNREDVVLWRALGYLPTGRYVEVGANHPSDFSVTKAFYDRGWRGITIEPVTEFVEAQRLERPGDTQVQVAVTDEDVDEIVIHEVIGTGLSTIVDEVGDQMRVAGRRVEDVRVPAMRLSQVLEEHGGIDQVVHFMLVDTEGAEASVLRSVDFTVFRPWVLVVEATAPLSTTPTHDAWEPLLLESGYRLCLFDGLNRFYVADEHADSLGPVLSYPACVLDSFVEARASRAEQEQQELRAEVVHWRAEALACWAETAEDGPADAAVRAELDHISAELEAMRRTVSWRVTAPIRVVRRWVGGR